MSSLLVAVMDVHMNGVGGSPVPSCCKGTGMSAALSVASPVTVTIA